MLQRGIMHASALSNRSLQIIKDHGQAAINDPQTITQTNCNTIL